jgi:hypothetical protein
MLSAKDISLASLKALVVDCVYRASLTTECDLIVLRRFIDCVLNSDIFHTEKYIFLKIIHLVNDIVNLYNEKYFLQFIGLLFHCVDSITFL